MNFSSNENNRWAKFSDMELMTLSAALYTSMQCTQSQEARLMYAQIQQEIARRRQFLFGGVSGSNS